MAKAILSSSLAVLFLSAGAFAQQSPPEPGPTPYLGRQETSLERIRRLDREQERLAQIAYDNLYGQATAGTAAKNREYRSRMVSLYRTPSDQELEVLDLDRKHIDEHAELLGSEDTGILKLLPDRGCPNDGKTVDASEACLPYDFPGSGSSYSFRLGTYRIRRLSDVYLSGRTLMAKGVLQGAIFLPLGDVPLEKVGLDTPGMDFLLQYKPVKKAEQALEAANRFASGVRHGGYVYGRGIIVNPGRTFAMRSIAYRGDILRSEAGVVYNELDRDKRRDIIVIFRILEVSEDGSPTIIYRMLKDEKAPKLEMPRSK